MRNSHLWDRSCPRCGWLMKWNMSWTRVLGQQLWPCIKVGGFLLQCMTLLFHWPLTDLLSQGQAHGMGPDLPALPNAGTCLLWPYQQGVQLVSTRQEDL